MTSSFSCVRLLSMGTVGVLACVAPSAGVMGCGGGGSGSGDYSCPNTESGGTRDYSIDAPFIDTCVYDESLGMLIVQSVHVATGPTDSRGDFIRLQIDGFTGAGTYTTSGSPDGTTVTLRGAKPDADLVWDYADVGSDPVGTCDPQTCTLRVVGATPSEGTNTEMTVEISCGSVNTMTSDCLVCTMHTPTIVLDASACEHTE